MRHISWKRWWWFTLCTKFMFKGTSPTNHVCVVSYASECVNALQLCCWQFSHKETLLQTFFERSTFLEEKNGRFAFLGPLWGLRAMHAVHLRLITKLVVDFLLVIIELFFARCKDWGAMSEYRLKILEATGPVCPKISGTRGCPHQPFFVLENEMNFSFIWYKNVSRTFVRFVTIHRVWWMDRQTDRETVRSQRPHCIQCSAVKPVFWILPQLDILCTVQWNNTMLKMAICHSSVTCFPMHWSSRKREKSYHRVLFLTLESFATEFVSSRLPRRQLPVTLLGLISKMQ